MTSKLSSYPRHRFLPIRKFDQQLGLFFGPFARFQMRHWLLSAANTLINIGRRSTGAEVARAGCAYDAFPRTNSFDDDINSSHCAVDLALHVVDLGLQEFLHSLEFGNQLLKVVYRI